MEVVSEPGKHAKIELCIACFTVIAIANLNKGLMFLHQKLEGVKKLIKADYSRVKKSD